MSSFWVRFGKLTGGLFAAALCATPQAYTISARPGAVNFVEGDVFLNGKHLSDKMNIRSFVAKDDILSTEHGRAEMLLTPGVFLRLGDGSAVRMVSPLLTETAVEVTKGEAIVEISELEKDNSLHILDHGATVALQKIGVYRFQAGDAAVVQVFDGKAQVELNDHQTDIGKGHELALNQDTKSAKFDAKNDGDDLYAWSKLRDEYESASSYAASKTVASSNSFGSFGNSYDGFGGLYGANWLWNSGWNSWAWLPGEGAFFSPFGFGYYAPGIVGYAPVVYVPGYGLGGVGKPVAVPVNPSKPLPAQALSRQAVVPGSSVRSPSLAFAGLNSSGGHVSSAAFSRAQSSSNGGSTASGYSGGSGRGSSMSSSAAASHSSGGGGGGGHH